MFNKIYYINLQHRKDRDINVKEQVAKISKPNLDTLKFLERVDAVYGNKLDINNISSDIITDGGKIDALDNNLRVYVPLTPGGIGCALSHRKVYQKILDDNLDAALILEDDITIDKDFVDKFNTISRYVPRDYDILFLGYHASSLNNITKINNYISKPSKTYGLFGYIVTNQGAKKLLNIFPITEQIDTEISNNFGKNKIIAYIVNPDKRIIFSDESSVHTKFGTDIQIREDFNTTNLSLDTDYLFLIVLIIITLIIAIIGFSTLS
jgi:GR25 family glycosyltransferase involved in LPS biosynthesis